MIQSLENILVPLFNCQTEDHFHKAYIHQEVQSLMNTKSSSNNAHLIECFHSKHNNKIIVKPKTHTDETTGDNRGRTAEKSLTHKGASRDLEVAGRAL